MKMDKNVMEAIWILKNFLLGTQMRILCLDQTETDQTITQLHSTVRMQIKQVCSNI